jgi:hypothetical protein
MYVFLANNKFKSTNYDKKVHFSVYEQISSGPKRKYTVIGGETALQLLQKTTNVQKKDVGPNAFIIEINGKKAEQSVREYWAFYVNNKLAEVGAGSYQLKPNDSVLWKVEKY